MVEQKKDSFENSLKLIVKSSFVVFLGLFLSKFLMYFYKVIIARHFGPETYGVFSLAIMVVGWFLSFASLGLSEGVLRFIPFFRGQNKKKEIQHIFRLSAFLIFISSIIAGFILFFSSEYISLNFFNNSSLIIFLKYFSFIIPIYLFSNFLLSIIRAFEKITVFSFLTNIFQNIVKVAFLGIFIWMGLKTNSVIFSYMLGILLLLLVSYLYCKYKLPEIFKKSNFIKKQKNIVSKQLISYSWPLLFLSFLVSIFQWIDSFFLGYFKGAIEVGIYNAAVPIALLLYFAPEIFMQLFFPLINKEFSKNNLSVIKELSKQVGKWVFILNIPLFLFLISFPEAIINILFGSEYISAAGSLRILSFGILFSSLFRISNDLLSMKGKSKLILYNIIFTSVINVFLNILLIPKYGLNGAALATTTSYIILGILQFMESKYYLSIVPLKKDIIKISVISLVPLVLLLWINKNIPSTLWSLIFQATFFVLLYILLILITKSFDSNDKLIFTSIKTKLFHRYL